MLVFQKISRAVVFLFCFIIYQSPFILFAQGTGGGGDPDVPIDGGLSILLVAGVTYGARRILVSKNQPPPSDLE